MEKTKSKPLFSFNMFVPINITISGDEEFLKELNKYCKDNEVTKTDYVNKFIEKRLRISGVKGYKELLKNSGDYDQIIRSVKDTINGFLGTSNLSRYVREEIKKEWEHEKV